MNKYMLISTSIVEAVSPEDAKNSLREQLGHISDEVTLISISDDCGNRVTIDPVPLWPPSGNDD